MNIIKDLDYQFYILIFLFQNFTNLKKILITIDDGFKSFYTEAWPYLKK